MKFHKLILASAGAFLLAGFAQAETIDITGSSAYRAAVVAAIQAVMPGSKIAYVSSLTGGNYQLFSGTLNGHPTIIRTSFTGSVEGLRALSDPVTFPTLFIPESAAATAVTGAGTSFDSGAGNTTTANLVSGNPVLALSDVYQGSTDVTVTLDEAPVGVVPFVWVTNNLSGVTKMTTQLANYLLSSGNIPLSSFTGVATDSSKTVYLTGRYDGSGTRATTQAETAFGVFNQVRQYYVTVSGSFPNKLISTLRLWPAGATQLAGGTNDPSQIGNGGYTSGGGIRDVIGAKMDTTVAIQSSGGVTQSTKNGTDLSLVSYLGTADAANSNATNSTKLGYNGIAYSIDAVINGQYTFWGYEHLYSGTLSTDAAYLKSSLIPAINTVLNVANSDTLYGGIPLTSMNVSRLSDGGSVTFGASH